MILVVDASALLAAYFNEPTAGWCIGHLNGPARKVMSTVTLTEACIRAERVKVGSMAEILTEVDGRGVELISVDTDQALAASIAGGAFNINLGDCFAYALARAVGGTILTLDADFRRVDVPVLMP